MNFTQLMGLATGHVEARIVQAAVELSIFDTLERSPKSADDIAKELHLDPNAAELLLNALAALSLLNKQDAVYAATDAARRFLVTNSPQYLGGMIRFEYSLWRCWELLPQAIRSGRPVRPPDMYQGDLTETETFIQAMDSLVKARGDTDVLLQAVDWRDVQELLDVGSGPATYPIVLCRQFPQLRATLFDLPATLKITERFVRRAAMADRIQLVAGDYRVEPVPGSYDAIFLSNIIHGESFDRNGALIAKLALNLKPGGRMIIKDHILDRTRVNPPVGAIFSLLMLLTTEGGRCYAFDEVQSWMAQAGLSAVRKVDLPPPLNSSLVIGEKTPTNK